jgi:retinol dehydrogenase-12
MWADKEDLKGRCALVTGGTDGIGKEIARGLAGRGVRVIIAGSDPIKGKRAAAELREEAGHDGVDFLRADLSLVREVDRVADYIVTRYAHLHYLVLCAGIVRGRFTLTAEGVETNFALGYLGRFVMVERLLAFMQKSGISGGAVTRILVISGAARNGTIHYKDVNLTHNFSTLRAVSQLCEANDVFAIELTRHLAEAGAQTHVLVNVLKVGVVRTSIRRQFPLWMKIVVPLLLDWILALTPRRVAAEALRLLLSPEFENTSGALFSFVKRFKRLAPGPRTSDRTDGHRLWKISERIATQARAG